MWFYTCYFLHIYLLIFDGIPFATTTLALGSPSAPKTSRSVNTKDIWKELQEVTEGSIPLETKDKAPRHLFQPTSFLNPGYGVLFEHIGQLHQSVYKHYLIVALKIPTLHHMPHEPEQWYKGCTEGLSLITKSYEGTFQNVFLDDFCARDRFEKLYIDITKTLHSDIPALLPNQEVPYADWQFFNTTPAPLPKNIYHPEHLDKESNRPRRDVSDPDPIPDPLPLLEVQRALDYVSKYGEPIPLEADTIYAEQHNNVTLKRHKRFLGGLIRGITSIFKGGNIFGKIVTGIKKVGGFIFKGIKGLLHRRKNSALIQAAKTLATRSRRFLVGKLYKFRRFRGLHLSRSSLSTTLRRIWHKSTFWMKHRFTRHFKHILHHFRHASTNKKLFQINERLDSLVNYTNSMLTFVNYRRESLIYLEKIDNELHRLVYGLEKLTNGQLSTAIIPARLLHKFLHKILREVRIQHPQFVPLYTELHHYYESSMNSYSNDKEHIFIQIPIYFVAANQKPMDLFRIHTVPVPLDIDTYQGKESKYTTLELQYKYLATNGHEYMDVTDAALDSCNTYHMDHLCENLHVTTDVKELNCAIAIYMDSVETSSHSAKHIQNIIKTKCRFIYHEVLHPTPTTLQTQDEILFANFPSENWQLICDEITDRPSFMKGALYTIINLQDLCTCGILTQEGRFLYESMRSCDSPDTEVDLHFTYNRALVSYDNHITAQDSKRYAIKPYPFQAPDLQYYEHMPYMTSNGTLHLRTRRHAPSTNTHQQAIAVQQFPLSEAVHKMETQEPIYVGPILPASFDAEQFQDDIEVPVNTNNPPQENIVVNTMDQPMSNFLFNIITLINTLLHFSMIIFLRISLKPGGMFYNVVLQMVQMSMTKHVTAVRLTDPLLPTPSEKPLLILDSPILEDNQYTTESPKDSLQDISPMISFSKTVTIFIGILFGCIIFWAIFKIFILPLFFKSTMCRQLCISCLHNSQTRRAPVTDIFLDIIHIYSGKQIRLYLTTISAPASALGFTGTVKLKNFKIITRKFQIFVDIDWHNCLLLYNNFIIPLPERGTAVPFQPNLLTDFNLQGPYNIVLLARHLDTMIQIPHLDNQEYMQSEEKLHFPVESPYKKIHDEVRKLMPLASSVATSPNSSRNLTDDEVHNV